MLPSVRELSERHGASSKIVFGVLQSLADEGVLYTVPRVGAFVGRPRPETVEPYLLILPFRDSDSRGTYLPIQIGFEDRIAQLGGHSMALTHEEAVAHLQAGALPPLSGIFETRRNDLRAFEKTSVPHVYFGTRPPRDIADYLDFDDVAGGAQATRHLQENGHRTIAFLGLHGRQASGEFLWSQAREKGWRQVVSATQSKAQIHNLLFLPREPSSTKHHEQVALARQTAAAIVGREDITAIVAANVWAARGMFEAFRAARWEASKWPSVVCFDSAPGADTSVVSYLRLPWEEIGRQAAQVLWERHTGRLTGAGTQRLIPMRLIPRLSCRADWAQASGIIGQYMESKPLPVRVQALQNAVA
jgi:DNA-binding LacI/PurR family transcriptional regulator